MEKRPFFRAAMAGLGKYHMGGYGRIGVYRVKLDKTWLLSVYITSCWLPRMSLYLSIVNKTGIISNTFIF